MIAISSCKEEDTVIISSQLSGAEERLNGEISISKNTSTVIVKNEFGGIIVTGNSSDTTIGWFMDKWAYAPTQEAAQVNVSRISFLTETHGDSLFITIDKMQNAANISLTSGISLNIPYHAKCVITKAQSDVFVSNLDDSIYISNVGNVTVTGLNNSCFISNISGNAILEFAFPANGKCIATDIGKNITASFPKNISASLLAKTSNGTITYSNLTIDSLSQTSKQLSGKINGNNGEIRLETNIGNIALNGLN